MMNPPSLLRCMSSPATRPCVNLAPNSPATQRRRHNGPAGTAQCRLMSVRDGRVEYTRRMHQVLEYIDLHLDQPLELAELAGVAHFSPFHFHRLFSAWMGETLGDYLRRRRLELAAMRLAAQPRLPVLNVALSVGFGSSEAFTRAFKARFGSAPTNWRQQQ